MSPRKSTGKGKQEDDRFDLPRENSDDQPLTDDLIFDEGDDLDLSSGELRNSSEPQSDEGRVTDARASARSRDYSQEREEEHHRHSGSEGRSGGSGGKGGGNGGDYLFGSEEFDDFWNSAKKWVRLGVLGIAGLSGLISSCYTVPTDSKGVIKRMGPYVRTEEPGIHLKLPFSLENLTIVPTEKISKEEFGFRTLQSSSQTSQFLTPENASKVNNGTIEAIIAEEQQFAHIPTDGSPAQRIAKYLEAESQMITGDLNVVDVEFTMQYRIREPVSYLFNVREVRRTIRDCGQTVMRREVGDHSVDEVLTMGREEIQENVKRGVQKILDSYDSGIEITNVVLQDVNPPVEVKGAFHEVNSAKSEKERMINEAWKNYNQVVPKAKGEGDELIAQARGYAAKRINEAQGNADRFRKLLVEYKKSPDVTMTRLYLETMGKVLPRVGSVYVIEQKGAEGGLLLKLDLENDK